jgi:ribonuclease HI
MNKLLVFTDGGSRGNPGPSAVGVYIEDGNGNKLTSIGKKIGIATNNVAEYSAIVEALCWLNNNKKKISNTLEVFFYLDSELAYSQLCGLYKVKNAAIRELVFRIRQEEAQLGIPVVYSHIPREKNTKADLLVNLALDNLL